MFHCDRQELQGHAIIPENVGNTDKSGVLLSVLSSMKVLEELPTNVVILVDALDKCEKKSDFRHIF